MPKKCNNCDGCGVTVNPEVDYIWHAPNGKTMDERNQEAIKFFDMHPEEQEEIECWKCEGSGQLEITNQDIIETLRPLEDIETIITA